MKAAGAERVLTVLLDKMSAFEEESSGPRRKGLEGQSSCGICRSWCASSIS